MRSSHAPMPPYRFHVVYRAECLSRIPRESKSTEACPLVFCDVSTWGSVAFLQTTRAHVQKQHVRSMVTPAAVPLRRIQGSRTTEHRGCVHQQDAHDIRGEDASSPMHPMNSCHDSCNPSHQCRPDRFPFSAVCEGCMEARPVSRWRASGLCTTTAARVDKVTGVQALSLAKRRSPVGVCFLFWST
jgi:hypothetical protein